MLMKYMQFIKEGDGIDFVPFLAGPYAISLATAYINALNAVGLNFVDPYERCCLGGSLDIVKGRSGDSKYIIRELFRMCYPNKQIPETPPMFRSVAA